MKDFNVFAAKAKNKLRKMVDPPKVVRRDGEPDLHRKPKEHNTDTDKCLLAPGPIENAFEAIRHEITDLTKHPTTKNITSTYSIERTHLQPPTDHQ